MLLGKISRVGEAIDGNAALFEVRFRRRDVQAITGQRCRDKKWNSAAGTNPGAASPENKLHGKRNNGPLKTGQRDQNIPFIHPGISNACEDASAARNRARCPASSTARQA